MKAAAATGTDESGAVMTTVGELPVTDFMTKNGKIGEDGRLLRDMNVFEVKKPS